MNIYDFFETVLKRQILIYVVSYNSFNITAVVTKLSSSSHQISFKTLILIKDAFSLGYLLVTYRQNSQIHTGGDILWLCQTMRIK